MADLIDAVVVGGGIAGGALRFVAWDETVHSAEAEAAALDLGTLLPGVPGRIRARLLEAA